MPITYDPKTGRYRSADGRFVAQATVGKLLDIEQDFLGKRLRSLTKQMIRQEITLHDWEYRFASLLKDSHLRMASLGSGGKDRLNARHFGAVGNQLRKQYEYLDGFAHQLVNGEVTVQQVLRRSTQYAASIRVAFSRAEQLTRENEDFTLARRVLDSQARHCPDCLRHASRSWKPIEEIVPIGTNCRCGQFCRCQIIYKR